MCKHVNNKSAYFDSSLLPKSAERSQNRSGRYSRPQTTKSLTRRNQIDHSDFTSPNLMTSPQSIAK